MSKTYRRYGPNYDGPEGQKFKGEGEIPLGPYYGKRHRYEKKRKYRKFKEEGYEDLV